MTELAFVPPHLSLVLPCYNEENNLAHLVERCRDVVGERADVEIVLVNNGSTDNTASVLRRLTSESRNSFVSVCTVPVNRGYGYGIMSGLRAARGEFLAWSHADLQTDPADVLAGLARLKLVDHPKRAFLRGVRQGRPVLDRLFTAGMALVSSVALGSRLHDINAQPKLFHRDFMRELDHAPDDFSLDLFALAQARRLGYRIVEQPVLFGVRRHGEAKGGGTMRGKIRLIRRTWKYIFELRSRLPTRT